ncbi:hypothetical protein [Streptomyces sp. NBC_00557]|uniref:hypothetical protein n=1 Tax=Streptomyces sp. NBC_00557 TaxID=2975776 RepID=UPI002E8177D4|nr:hypothetical protein [Streptomyces sp. NBC_00557]WUC39682.1 hypothetical protein OG956_38645 [Streptomyces sp. NBC_00557]
MTWMLSTTFGMLLRLTAAHPEEAAPAVTRLLDLATLPSSADYVGQGKQQNRAGEGGDHATFVQPATVRSSASSLTAV